MLPQILKKFRLDLGLSQVQIAAIIDIQPVRYGYYEGGKRNPKIDFYKRFKEVFDIDLLVTNKIATSEILRIRESVLTKKENTKPESATINSELPEILGDHEVRLIRLESFMEIAVPTMAELNAVTEPQRDNITEEKITQEISSLKGKMDGIATRHFSRLQGKLFSFLLFFSLIFA